MRFYLFILISYLCISQQVYCQSISEKNLKVGDAYFEISEYDNALFYYKKAFTKNPTNYLSRQIAKSYLLKQEYKQAESWYDRLIQSEDHSSNDILNYALTLKLNSKYNEAKYYFQQYLQQNPADSIELSRLIVSCDSSLAWIKRSETCIVSNATKLNSEYSDIAPSFYKDDIVFCSSREGTLIKNNAGATGEPFYDLFISKNARKRHYESPKLFSSDLNTKDHEGPSTFNQDYTEVYLTRSDDNQKTSKTTTINNLKLVKSTKTMLGWSTPEIFGFDDSISSFAHPSLSKNGKLFFFASDKPGGFGGTDIYVSFKLDSNLWSKPINLGPNINTKGNELYPYFYENEGILYFSSNEQIGMGGFDIFSAELDGKTWMNVTNLKPPINSSYDDFSFIMDEKKHQGFFSSNRPGGLGKEDIYITIFNY